MPGNQAGATTGLRDGRGARRASRPEPRALVAGRSAGALVADRADSGADRPRFGRHARTTPCRGRLPDQGRPGDPHAAAHDQHDEPVRRRARPGHEQHPLHRLRPGRPAGGDRPARAPPDLSAGGLGRARPARDPGALGRGDPDGPGQGRDRGRRTWPRSGSRTSARRRSSGTADRPADPQRDRLAGHPDRPRSWPSWPRDGGPDRFRATTGLPLATYFSGPKIRWILDHVDGARASGPRPATCSSARSTPG